MDLRLSQGMDFISLEECKKVIKERVDSREFKSDVAEQLFLHSMSARFNVMFESRVASCEGTTKQLDERIVHVNTRLIKCEKVLDDGNVERALRHQFGISGRLNELSKQQHKSRNGGSDLPELRRRLRLVDEDLSTALNKIQTLERDVESLYGDLRNVRNRHAAESLCQKDLLHAVLLLLDLQNNSPPHHVYKIVDEYREMIRSRIASMKRSA